MAKEKRRSGAPPLISVVDGMLVGLDEQLLPATPRIEQLVKRGKVIRGLSAQGGALLGGLPDDPIVLPGAGSVEVGAVPD